MESVMTRKSETIDNFRYDSIQEKIQTLEMKYNSLLVAFEKMTHRCCELDNRIERIKYHLYESNWTSHQILNLIYDIVKGVCEVKASGGIRSRDDAVNFINAGASRIGTSHII